MKFIIIAKYSKLINDRAYFLVAVLFAVTFGVIANFNKTNRIALYSEILLVLFLKFILNSQIQANSLVAVWFAITFGVVYSL